MNYNWLKLQANMILENLTKENSYIEYKASVSQKDKILKTICAFANNYYENDIQYIFIGIEEENDDNNKAVPKLPIKGISEGQIENCINEIKMLRPFLYPNVSFDILQNNYMGKEYILIVVPKQVGGPFNVSDRILNNKTIKLKPGRYIRVEAETRLARIDEEYDLMKKFSKSHFSSNINSNATVDVLDTDTLKEYLSLTSDRKIMDEISKEEAIQVLNILDKNDPTKKIIRNFGILMFCTHPEDYIPGAYVELFVDLFGKKDKMFSRQYTGPIWKQYRNIVTDLKQSYINTLIVREKNKALHRKVTNYPFTAIEELVANAIVHNNYENEKSIQIYITQTEINIVNYNRPLPPLRISDLNERYSFNERNTENPEIRNMFRALGIIESFGTGIGEAKRALEENNSPNLYYKIFEDNPDVTSVVIPANEEYLRLMEIEKVDQKKVHTDNYKYIVQIIRDSKFSEIIKQKLLLICDNFIDSVFCGNDICTLLDCSVNTATNYLNKLHKVLHVTTKITGQGKGRYIFIKDLKSTKK